LIEVHHHNILKIERYIMNNKHDHSKWIFCSKIIICSILYMNSLLVSWRHYFWYTKDHQMNNQIGSNGCVSTVISFGSILTFTFLLRWISPAKEHMGISNENSGSFII
jgi:hypothetical protein